MEVNRSNMFVPIDNPAFVDGVWSRNCDGVILDLEDAVSEPHKAHSRTLAREAYAKVRRGGVRVTVRINHEYWRSDLDAIVWPGLDAVDFPKTESGEEIRRVDARLTQLERERGLRPGSIEIEASIETVRGITNAYDIVTSSPRVHTVSGGVIAVDMARDLAVEISTKIARPIGAYGVGETALATGAAGKHVKHAIDAGPGPGGDVKTGDIAWREAEANRKAGYFVSRLCLHPNRIEPFNKGFTPLPEEVEEARQIIARLEELDAAGEVEGEINGKIVDKYEAKRAHELLDWAEACASREREKAAARARTQAQEKPAAGRK